MANCADCGVEIDFTKSLCLNCTERRDKSGREEKLRLEQAQKDRFQRQREEKLKLEQEQEQADKLRRQHEENRWLEIEQKQAARLLRVQADHEKAEHEEAEQRKKARTEARIANSVTPKMNEPPFLSKVFGWFALISLAGGLIGCIVLWPDDPGRGQYREVMQYLGVMLAMASLSAGILQCALFAAIAQALWYIHQIVINTQGVDSTQTTTYQPIS